MVMRHVELFGSNRGMDSVARDGYRELVWMCFGSHLRNDVEAYMLSVVPGTHSGYVFRTITMEQTGKKAWQVTVRYADPDKVQEEQKQEPEGNWDWDVDTTGGTIKIYKSLQTNRFPVEGTDYKGAINVQEDGVQGCDKVIPAMKITFRGRHPTGFMTLDRARAVAGVTGTVNNSPWLGFAAGEMLFLGSNLTNGKTKESDATYTFACAKNLSDLTFSETISGVNVDGHDYLWIRFEDSVVTDGDGKKSTSKKVKGVYVERIYERIDYAFFGITVA